MKKSLVKFLILFSFLGIFASGVDTTITQTEENNYGIQPASDIPFNTQEMY